MNTAATRERRQESTQESGGQVLWLAATVIVAILPHLAYVVPWVPVLVFAICGWRLVAAYRRHRLPSAWIRLPLTVLGFIGILLSYRQVSGLDAGSALLMVMVAMKMLETRGHRDRAVVIFICLFLLFAAFLREQSLWAPLYLLASVLMASTALLQIARVSPPMAPGPSVLAAGKILLQALPFMIVLFLLFPRVPGPFWSLPQRSGAGTTGLTDSMTPGDLSELALSDKVAFRVRFPAGAPRAADLYWRGPVLSRFDGRTWDRPRGSFQPGSPRQFDQRRGMLEYEVTLEPHQQHWLLGLETPVEWDAPRAALGASFALLSFNAVDRRLAYKARSALGGYIPSYLTQSARAANTWLPSDANPRSVAYARELRAEYLTDAALLDAILLKFRREAFYYSLTPALLGAQSVDEFLFDTREGFCGHYASAFAFLARAAGIPARVVTGYQGGEPNPLGSYWIVRQADAHAWVEVWRDGGWLRYDPTAAVAPERIENGMDAAIDSGSLGRAEALRDSAFAEQLLMSWDAINAAWNRWVLSFGPDSQASMLKFAGIPKPTARHLIIGMTGLTVLCLIVLAWYQRQLAKPRPDLLRDAYDRLCRETAKATRLRRPQETAAEYLAAASKLRPDLGGPLSRLFDTYLRLRYDPPAPPSALADFVAEVKRFRPPRRAPANSPASAR